MVTRHGARCTILSHFCPLIFARMPSQLSSEKSSITDFTLLRLRTFSNEVFFNFFARKICAIDFVSWKSIDLFERRGCFKTTNGGKSFWSTRRQVHEQREKGGDRYRWMKFKWVALMNEIVLAPFHSRLTFLFFFFHVSHSIDSCNPCLSCVGDLNDRSISRPTDPLLFDSFDRFWKWKEHVKYFDRIKSKIVGPISTILYRLR